MNKTRTVAQYEFVSCVRRKSYLIVTLGMPLLFGILAVLAAAPTYLSFKMESDTGQVPVVDHTGGLVTRRLDAMRASLKETGRDGDVSATMKRAGEFLDAKFKSGLAIYGSEEEARADLTNQVIDAYFVVPGDYVEDGVVYCYTREETPNWAPALAAPVLKRALVEGLLDEIGQPQIVDRVKAPLDILSLSVRPDGSVAKKTSVKTIARIGMPYFFSIMLMLSIFVTSGYLVQGLSEEKSSRVMEMILSSVSPMNLLTGKLIGLGAAGLLQFSVWVSVLVIPVLCFGLVQIGFATMVLSLTYFLLGFVLFGCLCAAVACLMTSTKESQQLAGVWMLMAAVPMVLSPMIVAEPNALLARVLSFIPVTAPITMIIRCATRSVLWIDVPISIFALVTGIAFSMKAAAKMLRLSLLRAGKAPTIGQILRAIRAA